MSDDKTWLDARRQKSKGTKRHEERIAAELGGYRLPASGAMPASMWSRNHANVRIPALGEPVSDDATTGKAASLGADIVFGEFVAEHKRTEKKSISVQRSWLVEIEAEAWRRSAKPAVIITFEGRENEDWAVIPLRVLKQLLEDR